MIHLLIVYVLRRRTIATLNANNEHYSEIFVWKWAAINAEDFVHETINSEYHQIFGEFTKKNCFNHAHPHGSDEWQLQIVVEISFENYLMGWMRSHLSYFDDTLIWELQKFTP